MRIPKSAYEVYEWYQIAQNIFLHQTRLFGVVYIVEYMDFIRIFRSVSVFDTVFKIVYRYGNGYSPWGLQITKHPGNERFRIIQTIPENLSF